MTIAVGFVVDDAIVMVEVIWRRIEHGEKPFEAALAGAGEIGFTILTISISLIAVFTPLMFMGGVVGPADAGVRPDAQRRGGGLDGPVADADADAVRPVPASRPKPPTNPFTQGAGARLHTDSKRSYARGARRGAAPQAA